MLSKRQIRWLDTLAEVSLEYTYKPGSTHSVPDALSRRPHGDLAALSVEPSFLHSVASHLREDTELAPLLEKARGPDPEFRMSERHGVELLVCCDRDVEQVVIPAGHGLRQLLMEEAHVSAIGGHLGVGKMMGVLCARVFWPGMRK